MSDTEEETKPNPDQTRSLTNSKSITVVFKLNGRNYPLWSRLIKVKIGGRGAYSYIRNEPPSPGSKGFEEWEENDLILFSWIVDNIEDDIISDIVHHQTSKALWDSLAVTYENKADKYLIYDLEEKVIAIKQGNLDLETYYRRIHGLWVNIDRCQRQPVTCCDKGIDQYKVHSNEKRLVKFLTGLNQEYDSIRREILKEEPYPSVEVAYGWVKTEAARRRIMPPTSAHPPQMPTAKRPIHHMGKSGTNWPHRATVHRIRVGHHSAPQPLQPPADQGTIALTPPNCGAPTVANKTNMGNLLQAIGVSGVVGGAAEGKGSAGEGEIRRWSER